MSDVTIYHNPDCGTSRNTLALIRNAGIEPQVIEYLREPPSRQKLSSMIRAAGLSVRQALREKGTPYHDLGLSNESLTDEQLLDAMMAHPILINRPFVETERGTRLCRPSEVVLEILPQPQQGYFAKEDGEVVINERDSDGALAGHDDPPVLLTILSALARHLRNIERSFQMVGCRRSTHSASQGWGYAGRHAWRVLEL